MIILPFYVAADSHQQLSVFHNLKYYNNINIVSDIFEDKGMVAITQDTDACISFSAFLSVSIMKSI